jgi:hypothetical protein
VPVQLPDATGDPSVGSWVRALVGSARNGHQFYDRGPLNPRLTDDDRGSGCEGVYGFESHAAPGGSPMKRASPAAPLMAAAEGAVDAYTRQSGGESKPGAGPVTVSRQATEVETAAFG